MGTSQSNWCHCGRTPGADAGTFILQLTGGMMQDQLDSQSGIKVHTFRVGYDSGNSEDSTWNKTEISMNQITESFNKMLLSRVEEIQSNPASSNMSDDAQVKREMVSTSINSRAKEELLSYQRKLEKHNPSHEDIYLRMLTFDEDILQGVQHLFMEPETITVNNNRHQQ